MTTEKYDQDRLLTSWEVGALLQADPTSVNKWVNQGRIPAFRTPGGHRRIKVSDLVRFLQEHKMPIPAELVGGGGGERARLRLLIVDDNPRYLRSVGRLLSLYEDRIDARLVDNGIEALVMVGSFRPQVIVLDVVMPEIDGIEVCRRLKESPDTKGTEVIMTTGHPSPEVERRALAAGASRVYAKPFDFKSLLVGIEANTTSALT